MNKPSYRPFVFILIPLLAGCAHPPRRTVNPFLHGRPPEVTLPDGSGATEPNVPSAALADTAGNRHGARDARTSAQTIEAVDPSLNRALAAVAAAPTPAAHRRAAAEYLRLGVRDQAADHLTAAIALDPRDAEAYDLRARLWRDWGFPGEGLGDAHRAVHFAPASAAARNTLGTVLQRLGRRSDARAAYERALALDTAAAYVLNNLCALSLDEGDASSALAACRKALSLDPEMAAAALNLEAAARLLGEQSRNHDHD